MIANETSVHQRYTKADVSNYGYRLSKKYWVVALLDEFDGVRNAVTALLSSTIVFHFPYKYFRHKTFFYNDTYFLNNCG